VAHRLLLPARTLPAGGNGVSRFSRMKFLCMLGVLAQELESAFRLRGAAPRSRFRDGALLPSVLPDAVSSPNRKISELSTQPADTPVQRFKCDVAAALTWLGARVVRYTFPVRLFSFATPCRFIPALSRQFCLPHKASTKVAKAGGDRRIACPTKHRRSS
jgi:hypothetical protein